MKDIQEAMKQHAKKNQVNPSEPSSNGNAVKAAFNGFATAEELNATYRTASYDLSVGQRVQFRQIPPGDRFMCQGRAISSKMTELGLNPSDNRLRQAYVDRLTREERDELEKEIYQRMICVAATQPRFSMLPPERCERDVVSVWVLSETDVLGFGGAIDRFGNENDEGRFRADSSPDQGGTTEVDADEDSDGGG